jgi:lipopolysaccharide export system protein LptC
MAASGIELNLPDLPEVPIRLGTEPQAPRPARAMPWGLRMREALTSYLPLLMMVMLALGTWWLVKNSPQPLPPRTAKPATGEPDYTMRGFTLQRFLREGPLQMTLEGRQLHHYPDSDRIEIEELRLTLVAPDGRRTLATARKAVSNSKASEVQLQGGAQIRGRTADGQEVEIDSEYLRYFAETERAWTDRAVRVRVGSSTLSAGGLNYDNLAQRLELAPPIRALLQPPSARSPAR